MQTTPDRISLFPFGDYWESLPEITIQGAVNPFKFHQRMAIYKLLIGGMNPHKALGLRHELNPFWGFVSQLDWQWRSGRLASPKELGEDSAVKPDTIAMDSWWGCCNYALSVIPLISAMQVGIAPHLEITLPKKSPANKFASGGGMSRPWVVPKVYETALAKWRRLFHLVKRLKTGDDLEPMRKTIWEAHLESITTAIHLYTEEFHLLPKNEMIFGTGWVRMVDFLGMSAWRTDMNFMFEYGRGNLPPRILVENDRFGGVSDFDVATNETLINIASLGTQNRFRFMMSKWMWQRAMRTRIARDQAPRLLAASFDRTAKTREDRKQLQHYIFARE